MGRLRFTGTRKTDYIDTINIRNALQCQSNLKPIPLVARNIIIKFYF